MRYLKYLLIGLLLASCGYGLLKIIELLFYSGNVMMIVMLLLGCLFVGSLAWEEWEYWQMGGKDE